MTLETGFKNICLYVSLGVRAKSQTFRIRFFSHLSQHLFQAHPWGAAHIYLKSPEVNGQTGLSPNLVSDTRVYLKARFSGVIVFP